MHLRFTSALFVVAALSACAAQDQKVAKEDAGGCQVEYRVGSNIPVRNCAAYTEEERRQMQRVIDDARSTIRPGASKIGSGS